jgi:hypothetical protein
MGEFLVELLLAFAELFFEVLLEVGSGALLDLASRAVAEVFKPFRFSSPVLATAGYTLLGAFAGDGAFSSFLIPWYTRRDFMESIC